MHLLPKDLNKALEDMENSVIASKESSSLRFLIELKFEGLKINKIALRLNNLFLNNKKTYLTFSDSGSAALAQRDNESIKENIFTFKTFNDSKHISEENSILISISPQPFDFDTFEPMCENFKGKHYSINPKFEDANVGIGSVIRERRNSFVKNWVNIYFIQPLNKGALMHIYPNKWSLFKEINNKYFFIKDFDTKPDNETIFISL